MLRWKQANARSNGVMALTASTCILAVGSPSNARLGERRWHRRWFVPGQGATGGSVAPVAGGNPPLGFVTPNFIPHL